jgi:hypothetical protein
MLEKELNGPRFDPYAPGAVRPEPPPPDGGVPTPKSYVSPPAATSSAAVDTDLTPAP